MREVLLGRKDVLVARQVLAREDLRHEIVVNRLPGPVAIEQLLRAKAPGARSRPHRIHTIHYPGNGLPLIELRLLQQTFGNVRLLAFGDIMRPGAIPVKHTKLRSYLESCESAPAAKHTGLPLRGKVIAVSTAHCRKDLAALGYLPQHQDETLIHVLRPLLRLGADVLFAGNPPTERARPLGESCRSVDRNITATLLELLSEERREDDQLTGSGPDQGRSGHPRPRGSLLFNIPPWPRCLEIKPSDEAAWINTCRILRVTPEDAHLPPWSGPIPKDIEDPPPGFRRYVALTLREVRWRLGGVFKCRLPVDGECTIRPAAFIFLGGRLAGFRGLVPGILEEFLSAAQTGRPLYLFGGLGGATGVIARALVEKPKAPRPPQLSFEFYRAQKSQRKINDYAALLAELTESDPKPEEQFDQVWNLIQKARTAGLDQFFNNGLSQQQNRDLLTTKDTTRAVHLVWTGISQVPGMLG